MQQQTGDKKKTHPTTTTTTIAAERLKKNMETDDVPELAHIFEVNAVNSCEKFIVNLAKIPSTTSTSSLIFFFCFVFDS